MIIGKWSYFLPVIFLLGSCGQEVPPTEQRLIILGFDGMDPVLARQWMDDGSLPNFQKLATMGGFHSLPTSNPPQSPVAWSDFATGTGPGEHGIYDFLRRDPETHLPDFSISRVVPPQDFLSLFGMELPLDDGEIINRRIGTPFLRSTPPGRQHPQTPVVPARCVCVLMARVTLRPCSKVLPTR